MLRVALCSLLCILALNACGSSQSPGAVPGMIEFGTSQSRHLVKHPTASFGPDDTLAYVAHVKSSAVIPPHSRIHEVFVRVSNDGKEHAVLDDFFQLSTPITNFITFNSFPIAKLYLVGFIAPGNYRVRLIYRNHRLAQGRFSLK